MFNLCLPSCLQPHYRAELHAAHTATTRRDWSTVFTHLERAHIIGQRWALPHTRTHLLMSRHGVRTGDGREILGQVLRVVGGFFLSLVGRVPTGNTGGANVPAEQPTPLPADLREMLARAA